MKKEKGEDMEKSRPGTVCTSCDGFGKQYSNFIYFKEQFQFQIHFACRKHRDDVEL